MATIALIGVPSQSGGRPIGVARGVGALRAAGVVWALGEVGHVVLDQGDVSLPPPTPGRDPVSEIVNPEGLSELVRSVATAIGVARLEGGFPLVLGGDCPMLLGALAAAPGMGLLHVDGHEDAYLPSQSPTGDTADSEIAFALGTAHAWWDSDFVEAQPLLVLDRLVMVGQRDAPDLERHGVESLSGRCLFFDDVSVSADPAGAVGAALGVLGTLSQGFWFHLDWDVLSNEEIGSVVFPRGGGLTWDDLAIVASAALSHPRCRGWSAGTYNPDLDPDGDDAVRIVDFLIQALRALDDREERTA